MNLHNIILMHYVRQSLKGMKIKMNGFFKWFKSGAKIKRWIFLMLIGIVLVCYGIAKVLVTDEMGFRELTKIIFVFVLGIYIHNN